MEITPAEIQIAQIVISAAVTEIPKIAAFIKSLGAPNAVISAAQTEADLASTHAGNADIIADANAVALAKPR